MSMLFVFRKAECTYWQSLTRLKFLLDTINKKTSSQLALKIIIIYIFIILNIILHIYLIYIILFLKL